MLWVIAENRSFLVSASARGLRPEDHSSLLHVDLKLSPVALPIGKHIRGMRSFWFIVAAKAARRYEDEAMQFVTRRRHRYHKEDRRRAAFFRVYHAKMFERRPLPSHDVEAVPRNWKIQAPPRGLSFYDNGSKRINRRRWLFARLARISLSLSGTRRIIFAFMPSRSNKLSCILVMVEYIVRYLSELLDCYWNILHISLTVNVNWNTFLQVIFFTSYPFIRFRIRKL